MRYKITSLEIKLKELTGKQEQDKVCIGLLADKLEAADQDKMLDLMYEKILQRLTRFDKEILKSELEIELLKAGVKVYEDQQKKLIK